ncbi:MAG: cytochrome c [Nitrospirota bacterium]|nr:cytochrome c [Nitrospirota bacterium]MDH5699165.1 cytochrome c [Nitrospirota bacterium]
MSEVALLQIIGLCVVGTGLLILLFIKGMFLRVLGFVAMVLGTFSLIALSVPQMASLPPAIETFDLAEVKSPDDLAAIGQKIFFSKGQCALCHSIGPSESSRCPDLNGIGAKLAPDFIYESLTQPQAYIYLDFRHGTKPEEYPARMPHIDKDPIGLTKPEIYSVIAFLQKMSGEPISIKVEDIMESAQEPADSLKVALVSSPLKSQMQNLAAH